MISRQLFKLIISSFILINFSSISYANEQFINPLSFIYTGRSNHDGFKFVIYENNTTLYVTYFSSNCFGYPHLYKIIDIDDWSNWELINFSGGVETVYTDSGDGAAAITVSYSLELGLYSLGWTQNGEVCSGEMTVLGNTGHNDINPCENLFLYPSQQQKLSHSFSENEFLVVSPPNCPWVALAQDDWITISQNSLNWGSGLVHYSVSANPIQEQRNGSIMVYNEVFQIEQATMPPPVEKPPYLPYIPLLLKTENM